MDIAEIIKQGRRMCEAHQACKGCPLEKQSCNPLFADIDSIGAIILDWSTSHSEPRLPTWAEWWATLPEGTSNISINRVSIIRCDMSPSVWVCNSDLEASAIRILGVNSPIPPDLAEKLGIKPTNQAKE